MKIFGYGWAADLDDDGLDTEDAGVARLRHYARRKGWGDCPVRLEDPAVAFMSFEQRPAGGDLLARLSKGDVLIVAEMGDLFRTASDALQFFRLVRERGIAVHSLDVKGDVTSGRGADLLTSAMATLASYEQGLSRTRARMRAQQARARGRYTGGKPPFGHILAPDGTMTPDPNRRKIVLTILRLAKEKLSLRQIAAQLTAEGVPISHNAVGKIIRAERAKASL